VLAARRGTVMGKIAMEKESRTLACVNGCFCCFHLLVVDHDDEDFHHRLYHRFVTSVTRVLRRCADGTIRMKVCM
jgi:hypothetical protein